MFNITMLPAAHGDAIWIEYGKRGATSHICIDGGPIGSFASLEKQAAELPERARAIELLVVSHVDTDHIEGIVRMLATPRTQWLFQPDEIWFNGYRHLPNNSLGGRDGEFLSAILRKNAPRQWNASFHGAAVMVPETGPASPVVLGGGMELTLLSPNEKKLKKLARKWKDDLATAHMQPGDDPRTMEVLADDWRYREAASRTLGPAPKDELGLALTAVDSSAANGSSIAFLARFDGKSCLFLADAHEDLIRASIRFLLPPGEERLKVDAVKVSHHGSANNISSKLLALIDAEHYLISTNGDKHEHPDRETIEAIIALSPRDPVLWFNYDSETTSGYRNFAAKRPFACRYPEAEANGITLRL